MLCTFCSNSEPIRIDISALNLRICPHCFATFLPAAEFPALRRELLDETKMLWIKKMGAVAVGQPQGIAPTATTVNCLEHGTPLVPGTIPNYSFEGFIPTCCDLQHLPPSIMAKILEISLGASLPSSYKRKINPVSEFLGGIVFRFWEKKQKKTDDGLDRLQYDFKFKHILGE